MDLDKWKTRQAQQYADENGLPFSEAVARLFPEGEPAPVVDAGAEGDAVNLTK